MSTPSDELQKLDLPESASKAGFVTSSSELFKGSKLVLIHHNEHWYKLTITKQGKLILTK